MPSNRVFTIAPGAPFLKSFVKALLDGDIIDGFSRTLSPLAMADATIYVPTRRAARSLAQELSQALAVGGAQRATLLPQILPLGALDATETALFFEEPGLRDAPRRRPSASGQRNLAAHAARKPDPCLGAGVAPRDHFSGSRRHAHNRSARALPRRHLAAGCLRTCRQSRRSHR